MATTALTLPHVDDARRALARIDDLQPQRTCSCRTTDVATVEPEGKRKERTEQMHGPASLVEAFRRRRRAGASNLSREQGPPPPGLRGRGGSYRDAGLVAPATTMA